MIEYTSIDLDDLNSNSFYEVPGDSLISISVSDNAASTGYSWELIENECGVRFDFVDEDYLVPEPMMPGAPSTKIWYFETLPPEANYVRGAPCDVTFARGRSWESSYIDTRTVTVSVN